MVRGLVAAAILLFAARTAPAQTGYSTGLRDTLIAIAGRPAAIRYDDIPFMFAALYVGKKDHIVLAAHLARARPSEPELYASTLRRMDVDWILSHEFCHRWDARRYSYPSREWLRDHFKVGAGIRYANTDLLERWAECFANAVDLLRATARGVPVDYQKVVEHREWLCPGTDFIVWMLLELPIYKDHPLNRPWPGG